MPGGFSKTSSKARLIQDGGDIFLVADCAKRDGVNRESSLNLDKIVGNDNGSFKVPGVDFSSTAKEWRIEGNTLRAQLRDTGGGYHDASLNLDAFIGNKNGHLVTDDWIVDGNKHNQEFCSVCWGFPRPDVDVTISPGDFAESKKDCPSCAMLKTLMEYFKRRLKKDSLHKMHCLSRGTDMPRVDYEGPSNEPPIEIRRVYIHTYGG